MRGWIVTSRSGAEVTVPYYFNLAPNYDLTLAPRLSARRGVQLGADFRYLFRPMRGEMRAEYAPRDPEADRLFQRIKEEFTTLPFCERWCDRLQPDSGSLLRVLHRHGVISSYPVLIETHGGMVSQAEHTILAGNGHSEITTL